jgi:hypothetical protein
MSKLAVAIVFAMVTVLTGSAHATLAPITQGSIDVVGAIEDTVGNFRGNAFEAAGVLQGEVPLEVYATGVTEVSLGGSPESTVFRRVGRSNVLWRRPP